MVTSQVRFSRATSFALLVISLVALVAMLAGLMIWLLRSAVAAEGQRQKELVRFASVSFAATLLAVLILIGVVARYVARRLGADSKPHKPMGYVDAWAEAGRRLKPEDAPPVEGFEDEESDTQTGP